MGEKNIIGERLRLARCHKNPVITQEDLLARLQLNGSEIPYSALSKIEQDKRGVTDIELVALSKALKVSVLWLLGIEKDEKAPF